MAWSGEANVHVSIANWIKGTQKGKKRLYIQEGNDPDVGWRTADFDIIGPSLSFSLDVTQAKRIEANAKRGGCFQGQTHGHKEFLMQPNDAKLRIGEHPDYAEVLFPFLIADDLIGEKNAKPTRYVIDFGERSLLEAQQYTELFDRIKRLVLPTRQKAAAEEAETNESRAEPWKLSQAGQRPRDGAGNLVVAVPLAWRDVKGDRQTSALYCLWTRDKAADI